MFPAIEQKQATASWQETPVNVESVAVPRPTRGARLPDLIGQTAATGAAIGALKIAVIGNGAVGRCLAVHLARAQIDTLWLVDPRLYKPESLLTQAILPADIGQSKAMNTAALCRDISPDTRVWSFAGPAEQLGPLDLADADLVLLATDNLAVEVAVGQRCLNLGVPLVQASVYGGTLTAQVRYYANSGAEAACPACGFGATEWAMLNRHTRFSCDGGLTPGKSSSQPQNLGPATASFSFLCSLAADLALVQVLRHALQLGPANSDLSVEYCGFTHRTVTAPLLRNPDCRCEHVTWRRSPLSRPLSGVRLRDLVAAAGLSAGDTWRQASITLDGHEFATKRTCGGCGRNQDLGRFVGPEVPAAPCTACGGTTTPLPFFTHRRAPLTAMADDLDRPLGQLILNPRPLSWAVIHSGEDGVCFRHETEPAGETAERSAP